MEEFIRTKWFVTKGALGLNLFLAIILTIIFDSRVTLGILLGGTASIVNFLLLARSLSRSVQYSPKKAGIYTFVHYILRYGFLFLVLYVAIQRPEINIVATIVGLLTIKAVILVGNLFQLGVFETKKSAVERREDN